MVGILPGTTFGLAYPLPVGCSVTGTFEEIALNECFYHMDGMSVFCNPVLLDTPHNRAKDMAAKMWNMHLG